MTYKCECCGFERNFVDGEEAFEAGWDAPPHFTGYVCCDLCPGAFVALRQTQLHEPAHRRWARTGRPDMFELPRDEDGDIIGVEKSGD